MFNQFYLNEDPLAYLRSLQNFGSILVVIDLSSWRNTEYIQELIQKGNIFKILLENKYFNSHNIKDFIRETIISIQLSTRVKLATNPNRRIDLIAQQCYRMKNYQQFLLVLELKLQQYTHGLFFFPSKASLVSIGFCG